ncbi:hypothetical protein BpOF4_04515 [Alkalihalophilus pseudofirmus OF4]|uniref:Uncharacterized protein n=1 Tax=Alkalihalophilus pseudofirmus (strain ATCC BAA-2126 / JCM 17055 / OF4) TaxID=398511 RepID=D3FYT4_ALKPO|nr:hypothetical protein [Alkalihalophilus pseudofirmus]ADC48967.1 hypothetical protein BpOF4_04515 [Alkalihalophilus pseudofirmus OF4]
MKKILAAFLLLFALTACGSSEPRHEVTEDMINYATDLMKDNEHVSDAAVSVQDDNQINLAIIAENAAISEELAKELSDSFVRALSSRAAMLTDYEAPSNESLGGLWDDYRVLVGVYDDSQNEIVLGRSTAGKIVW